MPTRNPIPRGVILCWLGSLTAVLLAALSEPVALRLSFLTPASLFPCLLQAELFFVMVVWPLFIPARSHDGNGWEGLALQGAILLVFALPLALLCAVVSNTSMELFVRGHLLVAASAIFVAALFSLAAQLRAPLAPWYYGVFFLTSAALPFALFLFHEEGVKAPMGPLPFVSPLWAALDLRAAFAPTVVLGLIAALLGASCSFLRVRLQRGSS